MKRARELVEKSGTARAIRKALGTPLLIDRAADESLAAMIERLRSVPGTERGNSQ